MPFARRSLSPPQAASLVVRHGGESFTVAVRRLANARRYTLRVSPAKRAVVLSMPLRGSIAAAAEFADRHAGWIAARVGGLAETTGFSDGVTIPFRGAPHRIEHRGGARGTVTLEAGEPPVLAVHGVEAHLSRRLTDWLRRQALADLQAAADRHCAALGVRYSRISVKDTTSRWGSCSSSGALAFSWRLILAPPWILDYLAAHEVAHLREMNHSQRFWRLCRQLAPRTDEARAWLRLSGAQLHGYG